MMEDSVAPDATAWLATLSDTMPCLKDLADVLRLL